jgi:hypothetical protein
MAITSLDGDVHTFCVNTFVIVCNVHTHDFNNSVHTWVSAARSAAVGCTAVHACSSLNASFLWKCGRKQRTSSNGVVLPPMHLVSIADAPSPAAAHTHHTQITSHDFIFAQPVS